jgi:perosamine synthetase
LIGLAKPVIEQEEIDAVLEVLESRTLSLGPKLEEFEQRFAAHVGAAHASAVSSGTAALHLAVRSLELREGDEVITSPLSFVASANAILYERAVPVFADIDMRTFNLDPQAVEAVRTERTAALLPVHIFGYPADIPALATSGLPLVEDAAQALGARCRDGLRVGEHGNPTVFAFYANKQITTGEGGMVTTGRADLKERFDSERNQGRGPDMRDMEHVRLGYNYRLGEIQCALGIAQLARLEQMLEARRSVADDRNEVIRVLERRGVQAKAYLPAIHLLKHFERLGYRKGSFPVCEDVSERSVALPFHPRLTEGEIEQVTVALQEACGR